MRRSWPAGTVSEAASRVPHAGQNLAPSGTSAPQAGHAAMSDAPHETQKRASSGFRVPHAGQGFTAASLRPGLGSRTFP